MDLLWIVDNRTIPQEVTAALQEIADAHQYSADMLHKNKLQIVEELRQNGKNYIVKFLFPNDVRNESRWLHALVRMEVRRLKRLEKE